jgi:uncharacterized membrane protein HdeD (DUF308 family)
MATITQIMNVDSAAATLGRHWGWLLALGVVEIIAGCSAIAGLTRITLALISRTALAH